MSVRRVFTSWRAGRRYAAGVSTTGWLIVGLIAGVLWAVQFGATVALMGRVERIVGSFDDAVQAWVDYAEQLKAERDQYAEDLKAAVATNEQLVATDAATDAEQAAALQAQLGQQLADALAKLQGAPSEDIRPKDKPKLESKPALEGGEAKLETPEDVLKKSKPAP